MDVTQWVLDAENAGPLTADGSATVLPKVPGGYTTPGNPTVTFEYPDGVIVQVVTDKEKVLIEGDKGRIEVNRGGIHGAPIEAQDADPALKQKTYDFAKSLFKGNLDKLGDHMGNFFQGFKYNLPVISNVESQHRSASACHIGNISIRLGRKVQWDAVKQEFVGDAEANAMLKREQRKPYQIPATA
jgi:hypothetical protein